MGFNDYLDWWILSRINQLRLPISHLLSLYVCPVCVLIFFFRRSSGHFYGRGQQNCFSHCRHERGAAYLIITKETLVLVSTPYAPHESTFHQGQKLAISILSGAYSEGVYSPTDLINQGHMSLICHGHGQ